MTHANEPFEYDLGTDLKITKTRQRETGGGTWVSGTIAGHRFNALVFAEHAQDPDYELGHSRLSVLWIQRLEDRTVVFNWDRGLDIEHCSLACTEFGESDLREAIGARAELNRLYELQKMPQCLLRRSCSLPHDAREGKVSPIPRRENRIRLLRMPDDPNSIPPGTLGTVMGIEEHRIGQDRWFQVDVAWDSGRSLMLVLPDDEIEIVRD